jgi:hypothetical protein
MNVNRPRPHTLQYSLIVVPFLALCLAGSILACASQAVLTHPSAPRGGVIPLCAWARGGRVGLWWNANVTPTRAFSNAYRFHAVCVAVLWSPALPESGRPSFGVTP